MAHQTGVVQNASYSKQHFDWIRVAKGNQNKCPPENQHFILTGPKSSKAVKIKVYHSGEVRNASQPEDKTIQQPCMDGSKKKHIPNSKSSTWKKSLNSVDVKGIMVSHTGAVRIATHSKEHFDWIMVAKGNQNKCPPENKHFLTELNLAYAIKIKVQHIGAVRNASQSEEKTI